MNALLWAAPIAWPLVGAVLVLGLGRGRASPSLTVWAVASGAVPALVLAAIGPIGPAPDLSWVFLDLRLALGPTSRILLATTALVWAAAGIAARRMVRERWSTACLWLLALTGNVGLVLAADIISLYTFFAVMTFAAYGLVVHDRTEVARRAGRVYMVMAVAGEVSLFAGLLLAAGAAGSTDNATIAAAIATAERGDLIFGLVTAGFAVKAGIVPLHVWLPLAHPAAPVPASAALSGAMIKGGLVGWLSVLPLGAVAAPGWSATLITFGLVTAVAGAVVGVLQDRAKVVLAYSSVSQMGLIAVLVGVGLAAPTAAPVAIAAAVTYALHHGVAKGALFLGVEVRTSWVGERGRRVVLAGAAVAGASLAGAPLTSGWVAKAVMKDAVAPLEMPWAGRVTLLLSLAAVGTTLLIARLLVLLGRPTPEGLEATVRPPGPNDRSLLVGWVLLLTATGVATWALPAWWLLEMPGVSVSASALFDGAWPVLVGAGLAAVGVRARRRRGPGEPMAAHVPAGDLVVPAEAAAPAVSRTAHRVLVATVAARDHLGGLVGWFEARVRPGEGFARLDVALRRWQVAGVLFVLVGAALTVALHAGGS